MRALFFISLFSFFIFLSCSPGAKNIDSPDDSTSSVTKTESFTAEIKMVDPKTILDYFILLQQNELISTNYVFIEKNGQWKCYERDEDREYESTVDLKNGYLSITDDGTGGGNSITELAIFKRKKDGYYIVLNSYGASPGLYLIEYDIKPLKVYEYVNHSLNDVTTRAFQKNVVSNDFYEPGYKDGYPLQVYYALPAEGTEITAKYNNSHCTVCDNLEALKQNIDEEQYNLAVARCASCPKLAKAEISIPFNKEKDCFVVKD